MLGRSLEDLIEVDLTQGQVRFKLLSEQHGTAQITTTVSDEAGNYWRETSLIMVESVNDLPVLKEFQSVVPVEHGYVHNVTFDLSDKDINADLIFFIIFFLIPI